MKNLKFVFILVLMIIILLIALVFGVFMKENKIENLVDTQQTMAELQPNNEQANVMSNMLSDTQTNIQTKKYSEFKCINNSHIIGKIGNEWYEILDDECNNIIGVHNEKLYCVDYKGFAYIDLTKPNYEKTYWLDYNTYETDHGPEAFGVYEAVIVDDDVYFMYSTQSGGVSPTDGIMKININDTDINNAVQFINGYIDRWHIDVKNKVLYYSEYIDHLSGDLYMYNLQTNEKQKMLENVGDFNLHKDKILYYTRNWDAEEMSLYISDLNLQNSKHIATVSSSDNRTNNLTGWTAFDNGIIYYKDGANIIKDNENIKDVIYTINDYSRQYDSSFFTLRLDGVIEVNERNYHRTEPANLTKFVKDGKVFEDSVELREAPILEVIMLDGTKTVFTAKDLIL